MALNKEMRVEMAAGSGSEELTHLNFGEFCGLFTSLGYLSRCYVAHTQHRDATLLSDATQGKLKPSQSSFPFSSLPLSDFNLVYLSL
jgi:hypothetical protein